MAKDPPLQKAAAPDVVPESPPPPQPKYVWYPSENQSHYSIALGSDEKGSRYVIAERNHGRGDSRPSSAGTIQEDAEAATSNTKSNTGNKADEAIGSPPSPEVMQGSPSNASSIFRRRRRVRSPAKGCSRDTKRKGSIAVSVAEEKRHDSPIDGLSNKCSSQDIRDSAGKSEANQQADPWEPIPWDDTWGDDDKVLLDDGDAFVSLFKANTRNADFSPPPLHLVPVQVRPPFQFTPIYRSRAHQTPYPLPTSRTPRDLPCPISPMVRTAKRRSGFFSTIVSPEAETASRLAASDYFYSASPCSRPKRSLDEVTMNLPRKYMRVCQNTPGDVPCAPSTWPTENPFLHHLWEYCASSRPHLLPTLKKSVSMCQAKEQSDSVKHKTPLESMVVEALVREWGGPLLGEVYRRVLSHQEKRERERLY